MLHIIGLITVIGMFSISAKKADKSIGLWVTIGIGAYLILGLAFLLFTDNFILNIQTLKEEFEFSALKNILSYVSVLVIILAAYLIQKIFLSKRKELVPSENK